MVKLKKTIKLLHVLKKQLEENKSEIRTIRAIESAIRKLEKEQMKQSKKTDITIFLLKILDQVFKHLPSIASIIKSFYSQ